MSAPFTLTIDWLAFTLPVGTPRETMRVLEGEWTQGKTGFRGYPVSWITAGAGRGIGKLGTGAVRDPVEVHVDLSAGIVAAWPLEKVRSVLQWVFQKKGHLTRIDCALDVPWWFGTKLAPFSLGAFAEPALSYFGAP